MTGFDIEFRVDRFFLLGYATYQECHAAPLCKGQEEPRKS